MVIWVICCLGVKVLFCIGVCWCLACIRGDCGFRGCFWQGSSSVFGGCRMGWFVEFLVVGFCVWNLEEIRCIFAVSV